MIQLTPHPAAELLTSKKHRDDVRARAAETFKDHVITTLVDDDAKRVHVYRCAQPGTGIHHFYVSVLPGAILVHGDIGELLIDHPSGGLGWLRSSVESMDYFLGKAYNLKETAFMEGDAEALLCDEEWRDKETRERIREEWRGRHLDDEMGRGWDEAVYEITGDCEFPRCREYDFTSLWCYEALRWFAAHLDALEATA